MTQDERRRQGVLYDSSKLHDQEWLRSKEAMEEFNRCGIRDMGKGAGILGKVFPLFGEHSMIIPPLYYSQGRNIRIGSAVFINAGAVILDDGDVRIGDHAFIGPNVQIYTAAHPIDSEIRRTGLQYVVPVSIGNNVWIGGNVTINPGISIGDNTVIGAGSVVTKDIPSGVIAAGNPCKVIRAIDDSDREYWNRCYQTYTEE